jgi:hypothetical protein
MAGPVLDTRSKSALESRRAELERGIGSDHDLPYTFAFLLGLRCSPTAVFTNIEPFSTFSF